MVLATHRLRLRYTGGLAEENQLDLYDGTTSLQGFAQSLQIATHAYLNNEIVTRATALRGAKLFVRPPRSGSVVFDLIAIIEAYPATVALASSAVSISAPVFRDFLKYSFRKACGLFDEDEPETPYMKRMLSERQEPFFDELGEVLEGSLQRAHRPIGDSVSSVELMSPRNLLIGFDEQTKDWVSTNDRDDLPENVTGNMTRFNSITRNGRAYIDQIGRIVPIRPNDEFPSVLFPLLTWSLHGSNSDLPKKLEMTVKRVKSASGRTKRLILTDCRRIEGG